MVRAAAKNHPSVAVVVDPARYGDVLAAVAAGGFTLDAAAAAGGRGLRAHRDLRRRGRQLVRGTSSRRTRGLAAFAGLRADVRAAVLRYGENPHQRRRALPRPRRRRPGLAGAEQLHGKEMCYNNYVDADAALRAAHDFDAPVRRDHQARQPVRHRASARRRRRGAPQGARLRPGVGLRRRHRGQPAGHRPDGRAGRRGLHRGRRRAGASTPARWRSWPRKKNVRLLRGARTYGTGAVEMATGLRRRCWCRRADGVDAPGDDPASWTLAAGEPADPTPARRPGLRLAGRAAR